MQQHITVQLLVDAVQSGAVYVVFSLGLTLVFGVLKIVNFAHGEFYSIGAFSTYFLLVKWNLMKLLGLGVLFSYIVAFICAAVVAGVLGYIVEKFIISKFRGDLISGLIVTLGLSMILQITFLNAFGGETKSTINVFPGNLPLFGGIISNARLVILVTGLLFTLSLYIFLKYTKQGTSMRAVAEDREAAQLQGIRVKTISSMGFVLGAILAAVAGVLVAPVSVIDPYAGSNYLMKAFVIIILGGMGSIPGCIIAGFILGIIESFTTFYFASYISAILSFALVIVILLLRPQGLMGNAEKNV